MVYVEQVLLNLVYHNDLPDIDDEDEWHLSKAPAPLVELEEDSALLLSHEKTLLTISNNNENSDVINQQLQPGRQQQQEEQSQQQEEPPKQQQQKEQRQSSPKLQTTPSAPLKSPLVVTLTEKKINEKDDKPVSVAKDKDWTYAKDDEPFLQLVPKTYSDSDLYEWESAPPVPSDPNEPGYMGE